MNIQATLTRCRHGQALVVLESGLGNGMEIRPHELRLLAQQLIAIADMAERLPLSGKRWKPTRVEIEGKNEPKQQPTTTQDRFTPIQIEHIRDQIIKHLDAARPEKITSTELANVISAIYLNLPPQYVLREIEYLEMRGLLTTDRKPNHWLVALTADGIDASVGGEK